MNLELFLSYSLNDFLLFSPDTWWLLYSDFARRSWYLLPVLITLLGFVLLSHKSQTNRRLYLMMIVQVSLLASCVYYYLDFYLQINDFSRYFVFVCGLQGLIIVWHFLYIFIKDSDEESSANEEPLANKEPSANKEPFVEKGFGGGNKGNQRDYALIALSMLVVAIFVSTEQNMLLLPGLSALSSLLLFLFFSRFYFRLNIVYLLPALLLFAIEIMTLYSMSQQYWWLPLLMFVVTTLRQLRLPTFR